MVISVWNHKTAAQHGAAKIVTPTWLYAIIKRFVEGKDTSDLAFTTSGGGKISHTGIELEQLSAAFGKKFAITPTENRKAIATEIAEIGTEAEIRKTARHMTHSVDTARRAYQHIDGAESGVEVFERINNTEKPKQLKRRRFTSGEDEQVIQHFSLGTPDAKKPTPSACRDFLQRKANQDDFIGRSEKDIQDKASNFSKLRKLSQL